MQCNQPISITHSHKIHSWEPLVPACIYLGEISQIVLALNNNTEWSIRRKLNLVTGKHILARVSCYTNTHLLLHMIILKPVSFSLKTKWAHPRKTLYIITIHWKWLTQCPFPPNRSMTHTHTVHCTSTIFIVQPVVIHTFRSIHVWLWYTRIHTLHCT